jgi:hypothetical protein
MSEQQTPPETEERTDAANTPEGTGEPEVNWQEKYTNLEADHTRAAQEAAQYRRLIEGLHSEDPDTRLQAAQALGLEFQEEEEPVDEFGDPIEDIRRELEGLKGTLTERDQQAQQAAQEQRDIEVIGQGLTALQKDIGRDLTEQEVQLLGDAAWQNRDENGLPNVAAVVGLYRGALDGHLQSYSKTKRAPHISPNGKAGTQTPNLDNRQERQDWMVQQVLANQQD